jgi:hypothetical protein
MFSVTSFLPRTFCITRLFPLYSLSRICCHLKFVRFPSRACYITVLLPSEFYIAFILPTAFTSRLSFQMPLHRVYPSKCLYIAFVLPNAFTSRLSFQLPLHRVCPSKCLYITFVLPTAFTSRLSFQMPLHHVCPSNCLYIAFVLPNAFTSRLSFQMPLHHVCPSKCLYIAFILPNAFTSRLSFQMPLHRVCPFKCLYITFVLPCAFYITLTLLSVFCTMRLFRTNFTTCVSFRVYFISAGSCCMLSVSRHSVHMRVLVLKCVRFGVSRPVLCCVKTLVYINIHSACC